MLVEFRVKNFGCLRDEQVLSLVPASDDQSLWENNTFDTGVRTVPRLLRTAVLYGPNAGGKSTVLRALQTMLDMVVLSAGIETNSPPFLFPFFWTTSRSTLPQPSRSAFCRKDDAISTASAVRGDAFSKNTCSNTRATVRLLSSTATMTKRTTRMSTPSVNPCVAPNVSGKTLHRVLPCSCLARHN